MCTVIAKKKVLWLKHVYETAYMWKLKSEGINNPQITWKILRKAHRYQCGSRRCDLCLTEKVEIALADQNPLLNKRAEIVAVCRHRRKFRYDSVKS